VLYIRSATNQSLLLTGDIEKKLEKQLLKNYPRLKVDVLQVPHHGSNTSSSMAFLRQLVPDIALFSFGYRNRFRHPAQKVLNRYKQLKIKLYNTSNGAIEIRSNITNNSFSVKEYRVENQRRWHRAIKTL
jgi:competence protein ComEC